MTKKRETKKGGFAELQESLGKLEALKRRFGMSDELVGGMLRDAEDGVALGLGAVPPALPVKLAVDARSRVELMSVLFTIAAAMHDRVELARKRNAPERKAA